MSQFMTTAEVAELMRTPQETLRQWRATGRGPKSFKFPGGRRVLYNRADVLAFIEAAQEKTAW